MKAAQTTYIRTIMRLLFLSGTTAMKQYRRIASGAGKAQGGCADQLKYADESGRQLVMTRGQDRNLPPDLTAAGMKMLGNYMVKKNVVISE